MYGLMRLLRNIYSWVGQALLFWFMVSLGYMVHPGEIELQEIVNGLINTQMARRGTNTNPSRTWWLNSTAVTILSLVQVQDGPAAPRKRIEEASDSFMHAPLGSGDIAQLVELRSCNWVVAITGWVSNCPGDSTETKMCCQERRRGRMGGWSDLVWIVYLAHTTLHTDVAEAVGPPRVGDMGVAMAMLKQDKYLS
ncbi:hypothetical protein GOBAR_AA02080 [Gossypium barbadense]|uniref:Uncharacterized protein n=1 Tax=Gossypium barbadense TaxID=3634 RepID=A0A2P5YSC9_GOSBA|nr:hypothetical protein GOBAR_AA02080 [Gossypium barbadense]